MDGMKVELYCWDCEHETEYENEYDAPCECPKCNSKNIFNNKFIICENCGNKMYLLDFTNECVCGEMYNKFGQHLAPIEYWDPEDVYASFGPQVWY